MTTKAWLFKFGGVEDRTWIRTVDGVPIAELHDLRPESEGYLIASAPTMREALAQAIEEIVRLHTLLPETFGPSSAVLDACRSALAKADGLRLSTVIGSTPRRYPARSRTTPNQGEEP